MCSPYHIGKVLNPYFPRRTGKGEKKRERTSTLTIDSDHKRPDKFVGEENGHRGAESAVVFNMNLTLTTKSNFQLGRKLLWVPLRRDLYEKNITF